MHCLPLLLCSLWAAEDVLDSFAYPTAEDARTAWQAAETTPPVEAVADGDRRVLRLAAPFAAQPQASRAVMDRRVKLDLASPGAFVLEATVDRPAAAGSWTLYFRSGDGWYGCGATLGRRAADGWQTLRFAKGDFRVEGTPAGWDQIDGIRIAAWRTGDEDAAIRLRRLAAVTHTVAMIVPDTAQRRDDGESRLAHDQAALVGELLRDLGIEADPIAESALSGPALPMAVKRPREPRIPAASAGIRGELQSLAAPASITPGRRVLGARKLAILAYDPRLGPAAIAALTDHVESGGKLLVCYQLPAQLAKALGFRDAKYVAQPRPDYFHEMRFEAPDIVGLPAAVRQASWNITDVQPAAHNARIVGRWFDAAGRPTGHAALAVSDRGAFYSHILLADDRARKQQMLAALLGWLHRDLWSTMSQAAIVKAEQVGPYQTLAPLIERVAQYGQKPDHPAPGRLRAGATPLALAKDAARAGAHSLAIENAQNAHAAFQQAYLYAQPSPKVEGRAVWNHSGLGAYSGDWERSAKLLADNGFNIVLPNMLWGGLAHYESDLLPRSESFRKHGDQIAQCCDACRKHGVEVHVWKVNFNLSTAPRSFVEKLREQGRLQAAARGPSQAWLCPSHPENRKLELDSMLEVARKYPVAGLHFDYIRYPSREYCYCDGCRQRFEAESGTKVADWPADCYSGPRKAEYHDWRCRQITALVAAVCDGARKLRPQLKISAAVFGAYPDCREGVGQDWPEWIKAGLLDFVCPMDYTPNDEQFTSLVEKQLRLVGGRVPIYPGIGATASRMALGPDHVVGQIDAARTLGAAGFTIFNFDRDTAETIIPAVGLGAGAQRATLP